MSKIAPGPAALKMIWQFYMQNPLDMFARAAQKYGDVVRFEAAGYTLYQIIQPDHIQHMAEQDYYDISVNFDQASPVVGRGLANNNGDPWKQQRRLMQPSFHQQQIASYTGVIIEETQHLIDQWSQAHGKVIDIAPGLLRLNHQILARATISLDFKQRPDLLTALTTIRNYMTRRFQAMMPIPDALPTPRNRRFWQAARLLDEYVYKEIAARRSGVRKGDLLDGFMLATDPKTGEQMTDTQLHDEINTILFYGYDDPSSSLAWVFYLLAQNPAAMEPLQAEAKQVLGSRQPIFADSGALKYTRMVIDEALRLYPPGWSILRDVQQDDEIGGYLIPKGTSVMVNIFLTHRLAEHWDQPEAFKPERFTSSEGRHRFVYLPFGTGARQCIGKPLAYLEMQLALAMLVRQFRFTLAPENRFGMETLSSLRTKYGMLMRVEKI